jgi:gliding motility-associated-like protein
MNRIISFSRKTHWFSLLFFISSFFYSNQANAQCAGTDGSKIICDITVVADQSVNLFSLLGGSPVAGGTWVDDLGSGGLNPITGVLNVLAISESGVYTYTYTAPATPGCTDTTSVVTIVLGGYTGIPGKGTECADSSSYNLFKLINTEGGNLPPHTNGNWYDVTNNIAISGYDLNPSSYTITVKTDITFSYSFPAVSAPGIGSCPAPAPINVVLTLYPPLEPGVAAPIQICSSDGFAAYTAVNLYDRLTGEDLGGTWTDISTPSTGELSNPSDTTINVQNIYNNFGAGVYSFEYKLIPVPPICEEKTAVVTVTIEDPVDYSGISLVVNSDICESDIPTATYTAQITQTPVLIPDGTYTVTYNVNGGASATAVVTFTNGVASFSLPSSNFQSVGTFTCTVTNIVASTALGICINTVPQIQDDIVISPIPVTSGTINAQDVCQNNSSNVDLINAINLPDGTYTITYNLSGANVSTTQTQVITITGGVSNFVIPGSLLANAGATAVVITSITNGTTGCRATVSISDSFTVNPIPVVPTLGILVNDVCVGGTVTVNVSGLGALTNVNFQYNLSGANTSTGNLVTVPVTGGIASFSIPLALLPNTGVTSIFITDLTNTGNACGVVVSNVSDAFTINPLPNAPTSVNQTFCETDNATVANLSPNGAQYSWYDSSTGTTPLASTIVLVSGTYYVSEKNLTTGCESLRTPITVTIDAIQAPTLNTDGQNFCGADNPTIQDLSNNTNSGSTVVWYDALTGGTLLAPGTLLTDGATYYGYDSNSSTGCLSKNVLIVTVSLTDCVVSGDFFIPDGFSPNGDGVNDSFHIPDIEFIYPNYKIEIYNRYGTLLFEGDKSKDWDGKNSTKASVLDGIAPNGVYFYIIHFNKDNTPSKQGRLYLNR